MIVRIRDHEGHIVAVDYNRVGERWTDTATRLYNCCVAPSLDDPKTLRRLGIPTTDDLGYGMHELCFRYNTATNVTKTDPSVTVIVDRRQTQQERERAQLDATRELRGPSQRRTGA